MTAAFTSFMCWERYAVYGWGEGSSAAAGARLLRRGATSLVNATHVMKDYKIRFSREGKQIEVLEMRPSECLRLKEAHRIKD